MCNHCPYVKAKIDDLNALYEKFNDKIAIIGINSNDPEYPGEGMEHMKGMGMMDEEGGEGAYINARDNVALAANAIGNGKTSLLFFHATWCGYCQAKDKILKDLYSTRAFPVSTYKIDFDTANDLKARYGITTQDTVVLIDGSGNALQTVVGATEGDLRNLLSSS